MSSFVGVKRTVSQIDEPFTNVQDFGIQVKKPYLDSNCITLGRMLGEGSFARVYAVTHLNGKETDSLSKVVAKVCKSGEGVFQEVSREAQILGELNGSIHFPKMYGTGYHKGRFYILEERCTTSLHDYLITLRNNSSAKGKEFRGLGIAKVVAITNHALRGIKHLHDRNLIHFDIKPANLLFGQDYFLKVADLNAIKEEGHEHYEYVVTRWYRAPEIFLKRKPFTKSVDIWSLACTIFETAYGSPLFPVESSIEKAFSVFNKVLGPIPTSLPPSCCATKIEQVIHGAESKTFPLHTLIKKKAEDTTLNDGTQLDEKTVDKMRLAFIDLLEKMLAYDPAQRISVDEALSHQVFEIYQSLV